MRSPRPVAGSPASTRSTCRRAPAWPRCRIGPPQRQRPTTVPATSSTSARPRRSRPRSAQPGPGDRGRCRSAGAPLRRQRLPAGRQPRRAGGLPVEHRAAGPDGPGHRAGDRERCPRAEPPEGRRGFDRRGHHAHAGSTGRGRPGQGRQGRRVGAQRRPVAGRPGAGGGCPDPAAADRPDGPAGHPAQDLGHVGEAAPGRSGRCRRRPCCRRRGRPSGPARRRPRPRRPHVSRQGPPQPGPPQRPPASGPLPRLPRQPPRRTTPGRRPGPSRRTPAAAPVDQWWRVRGPRLRPRPDRQALPVGRRRPEPFRLLRA